MFFTHSPINQPNYFNNELHTVFKVHLDVVGSINRLFQKENNRIKQLLKIIDCWRGHNTVKWKKRVKQNFVLTQTSLNLVQSNLVDGAKFV